jgi:hypothetical protein
MFRMRAAKPFRDQDFDRLADQFGTRVPKEVLQLRIDVRDPAIPIRNQDGVR